VVLHDGVKMLQVPLWRSYLAGCILLGIAPCTAMVLVWGYLARGNDGLTLVMVAINSLTMLVLYGVLGGFLLGVGRLPVPWQALLLSIAIYVALPLVAGYFSRKWIIAAKGETWFKEKFLHVLTPVTIIALLTTLVLLFSFKGEVILANPLTILWIAIPLFIQTMLIFWPSGTGWRGCSSCPTGRGAGRHDRRLQPLRGGHRHGHHALRPLLRRGAGHGGRRADRGAGDAVLVLDQAPHQGPKVAYFAGCSAGYLFPEVARATVAVMARNGINVFVPPQQCCGMPTLLEGDEATTLRRVRSNLKFLLETVRDGFDVVCSCPTCGFLMKVLLKERAYYSEAYQHAVCAGTDEIKVPGAARGRPGLVCLKKSMYEKIMRDDGYFSSLDPLERIALSETIMDAGEYLGRLHQDEGLDLCYGELRGRMAYYAPCHQREQGIGSPYLELLTRIPGLTIEPVGGTMDCCGMGGSLGFKKDFYASSTRLALPLVQKLRAVEPEAVITDCLSCRLQFQHLLPYPVYHPVEILSRAYKKSKSPNEAN
jgi:Fe-S oxidoreductase